ncbi:MAG: pyruvate, water dikinase, partial [Nitrospirota bacterium]
DGGAVVYEGFVQELVNSWRKEPGMEHLYEYRKNRLILKYISPLNLIDPMMDSFTPEGCATIHDIIRFIHEKSVSELILKASRGAKGGSAKRLELPVPAGIIIIDIGEALTTPKGQKAASAEEVASIPLRAIIKGMAHEGVWHSDMVNLRPRDFLSSMVRMPDMAADAGYNVAVASKDYVNLSLRFGYHFNMLDCYLSDNARNNHIYFRFAGGATEITKRSRRVQLISIILKEHGFGLKIKGDLIIARLPGLGREKMEPILDQLGRLISYTRQLDALLNSDDAVTLYSERFLKEDYTLP